MDIKQEIEKICMYMEKMDNLSKKLENDLNIKIPDYVIDEIVSGGRKENIIALIGLARMNNRISENNARIFINSIDKYLKIKQYY